MLAGAFLVGCNRQGKEETVAPLADRIHGLGSVVQSDKIDPRLQQPFADATLADQPDQYLPDKTMTGKSVGKLYEEVVRRWDKIVFVTPEGKRPVYTAALDTELGLIEIDLLPDVAPNHVRSFIALAQSGYYDGLMFERVVKEQSETQPQDKVELIEGGCPVGMGTAGFGSIGYWLKPEFSKDVHHEEGSVGACLGEDPDTAACRFYITLGKAPVMDGERTIFGKVTNGLDVVHRIATQPLMNSSEFPLGDRPEKPVSIRAVTIRVGTSDRAGTQRAAR
jgi:cyclophilin family peptidyl-prolyl cis-trans isomerase